MRQADHLKNHSLPALRELDRLQRITHARQVGRLQVREEREESEMDGDRANQAVGQPVRSVPLEGVVGRLLNGMDHRRHQDDQ